MISKVEFFVASPRYYITANFITLCS